MLSLILLTTSSLILPPAKIVVVGPGNPDLQLVTSKLGCEKGYDVTHFTRSDWIDRGFGLMYGKSEEAPTERPTLASTNDEFGRALKTADAIVLCAEAGGGTDIANTLRFSPAVKRLIFLSAIGGSKGIGGNPIAGENVKIQMCEDDVKAQTTKYGVELSIVRVGPLKGGGPPYGLDNSFYDTMRIGGYPTPSWQCAQDYDKATLGAEATAGDTIAPRSQGQRSSGRSSSSPQIDECSRIAAAGALLAVLRQEKPMEVSLSALAADKPPTDDEWDAMLAECAVAGAS